MRKHTTYHELNSIISELTYFQDMNMPTVKLFAEGKISRFYKVNSGPIQLLQQKVQQLYNNHVERNDANEVAEKGKYKMQKQVIEENGEPVEVVTPVFKDAMEAAMFKLEWDRFLSQPCTIEI